MDKKVTTKNVTHVECGFDGEYVMTSIPGLTEYIAPDENGMPRYGEHSFKFPMSLPSSFAYLVLKEEEPHELREQENYNRQLMDVRIEYGGEVDKDGNVRAYLWRSAFDGFAHCSGKVFEVTCKRESFVKDIVVYKKNELVSEVFKREEHLRKLKRMDEIRNQLFPKV